MIMAGNNFITYAAVFLVVFVPYLIVQTFIGDGKKHSRPAAPVGIPRLYRMLYPLLAAFSANAGDIMKTLRPAFCKKLAEKLKIANIRIDVSYVVSAQIILATALGIAGMLFSLAMGLDVLWLSAIPSLCIFIGWVYPATLVEKAAEERQASIIKSLPFAIDLISSRGANTTAITATHTPGSADAPRRRLRPRKSGRRSSARCCAKWSLEKPASKPSRTWQSA